ncbi:MAG: hypothetical protein AAF942_15235, partial [Pseudomonadota bacterium]
MTRILRYCCGCLLLAAICVSTPALAQEQTAEVRDQLSVLLEKIRAIAPAKKAEPGDLACRSEGDAMADKVFRLHTQLMDWDDPELLRLGSKPVLFVGAGSHALFFRPGDYVS